MGSGVCRRSDRLEDAKDIWLSPAWLIRYEVRVRRTNFRVVSIDRDPMDKLLHSSDRVLVGASKRVSVPPGIFVMWGGMGTPAKRVEEIPNSGPANLVIKSEHQTCRRHAEDMQISGRIIRSGRRL